MGSWICGTVLGDEKSDCFREEGGEGKFRQQGNNKSSFSRVEGSPFQAPTCCAPALPRAPSLLPQCSPVLPRAPSMLPLAPSMLPLKRPCSLSRPGTVI